MRRTTRVIVSPTIRAKKRRRPQANHPIQMVRAQNTEGVEGLRGETNELFLLLDVSGRNKPLAPTCNVCLIRDDLTTLWCEVTSSIRTRSVEDETPDETMSTNGNAGGAKNGKGVVAAKSAVSKTSKTSTVSSDDAPIEPKPKAPVTKELLLCLRPIRDGDGKVDESLRFVPHSTRRMEETSSPDPSTGPLTGGVEGARAVSAAGELSDPNSNPDAAADVASDRKRPPKKRQLPLQTSSAQGTPVESGTAPKRMKVKDGPSSSTDTEKSVVESLMLMSNKTSN